ncbi:hypothetical protein FE374_15895 [Georgenia yuyongxinii]|uniref:Uncharacterized protein n=1 Tax=Georgenia yuyongxinii TaxID=2589797 RepID=A0A5B8C5U3_9MICO|nr:hypothetical protein [Georgenia yuyongxinii]QDC25903.1 hypothetical protein FE374_15895 [Georgenia yuyongxinii]
MSRSRVRTAGPGRWREVALTSAMGAVTNIALAWMVLASPTLSLHLGAGRPGWVTPLLALEVIRMAVVGVIGLVLVRQRHGLTDRSEAARLAALFGLGTWVLLTPLSLLGGGNGAVLTWGTVTNLATWVLGALMGVLFVAPGAPSRADNVYLRRLDHEDATR